MPELVDAIYYKGGIIRPVVAKHAIMAVVIRGVGVPRGGDVVGVITKEHVADSVASSVKDSPR